MTRTLLERLEDIAIGYEISADGEELVVASCPVLKDIPPQDTGFSRDSRKMVQGIEARRNVRLWRADAATLREAIAALAKEPSSGD